MITGVVCFGINYCFYSPSKINKYIASNLYKTPANNAFEDDNFYQCVVDAYNSENGTNVAYTDSLSDSQLETITKLSCHTDKIVSAKGVEKLTSLTSLDMTNNQLTSLDISNNPSLTYLSVYYNKLTSLDVSGSPALTYLRVSNNQITELDVSNNPALTELQVDNNQLTSLDVSNNPKLITLDVSKNQITE